MKNKYIKGGRLSEAKFRKMLRLFCLDLDATQIAGATNINRNTVNRYLSEIRRRISIYNRIHGCGFCAFKSTVMTFSETSIKRTPRMVL